MAARKLEEQKVEKDRQKNESLDIFNKQVMKDNNFAAGVLSLGRIGNKCLERAKGRMAHELDMYDSLVRYDRDRLVRKQQEEQEEALSRELEQRELERQRDERKRQQIRQNSHEIRDLESKLRAAYTCKELSTQLADKAAQKQREMEREAEQCRIILEQNESVLATNRQRDLYRLKENVRYQQELERQLEEKEMKKQKAYEELLKEKLMIDEIARKIYEEDQRAVEREMERQNLAKQYMEDFKTAREVWKQREKEKMEEENRAIQAYTKLMTEREEDLKRNRKEMNDVAERVNKDLSETIVREAKEKSELEQACYELDVEEKEAKEREKERTEIERRLRSKLEMQRSYEQQNYFKSLRQQAEKEEEESFKQQMLAKMAEDDRLDQLNAQKRRMKQLEHRRALEKLLEERRVQFAAEREQEALERQQEMKAEDERLRLVNEERQALLKEHASRLLGYLPKGILKGDDDLVMLGDAFRKEYTSRQFNPFDDKNY